MNFQNVERYLSSLGKQYGLVGIDCKVMRSHDVLFRKSCGFRDAARTKPVSADNLYDVFSCTKVVTMVAAMQCVEQKLFQLEDPVEKYLPAFADMRVVDHYQKSWPKVWPTLREPSHPAPQKPTIRQMMTMTAGMSYDLDSETVKTVLADDPNADTVKLVSAMGKMPLLFDPGTRYEYSLGHDIVAAIIVVATGMPYRTYLQKNVFDPLELRNMFLHIPLERQGEVSAYYICPPDSDEIRPFSGKNRYRLTAQYDSGGAGICSTVDDFALIIDALACGGVAYNGYRLLTQESIDQMRTPQLNALCRADFITPGKEAYSYGLGVRTLVDQEKSKSPVGEFGWDGAAGAYCLVDPKNNISIFYAQEVLGMMKAYSEIHPTLRDLTYEAIFG